MLASASILSIIIAFVIISIVFSIIGFIFKIAWNIVKILLMLGLASLLAPFIVLVIL